MTTMESLNEVFRLVFDDPDLVVGPETTSNDVEGWDSLSHVNLITAVESRFGMRFAYRELYSMKNVGDLLRIVMSRTGH